MRILIVKLGSIGDVVHALPVLRTIRHNLPDAYIAWIIEDRAKEILNGNKDINNVITVDTKKWRKRLSISTLKEIFSIIKTLREDKFDIAIDLQGLIKSGVISILSGAKTIIGFDSKNCREYLNVLFTNKKISPSDKDVHVVDINLSLLKPFGFKEIKKEFSLSHSPEDDEYINEFFTKNKLQLIHSMGAPKPLIAINPAAGWKTKEWGIKNYAELCERIVKEMDADVMLTWGPGEDAMVKGVIASMSYNPLAAPPTSLRQLIALLRRCRLFVGGDTGPLHIAAALKIPTVAIYGPSNPLRNGPYGDGHIIVHKEIECSGCYKRNCDILKCMKMISVEEVFSAVNRQLSI
ncbi:MAG: lipopolysaccharide heptosyltransferase I [Nitrospinae bacterium]|nr:lipopolysaccharide heptosyltransferase I [Nitrospinota bacterium]